MTKTTTSVLNNNTTSSLNINREENFVVENSLETTQRFPGPSYTVGPIDQDALFHNELLQRRGLTQTVISPETIESVERTQLEIPTSITNHVEGSSFVVNNLINNSYTFNLNSFPVQIESIDSIISGFNNSVRTGFMQAISSIRNQELSNVEAVRASMQRHLDAIRLQESQALPLTINNNSERLEQQAGFFHKTAEILTQQTTISTFGDDPEMISMLAEALGEVTKSGSGLL